GLAVRIEPVGVDQPRRFTVGGVDDGLEESIVEGHRLPPGSSLGAIDAESPPTVRFSYHACEPSTAVLQIPRTQHQGGSCGGPGLARCLAPGRSCAARAFGPSCFARKVVSAPLPGHPTQCPCRAGPPPPTVVPARTLCRVTRRVCEPSTPQVLW